ncbi:MAG: cation diffusion facilitator family transporter [Clostridium sp.]|nr:cation diffusion facilitator family transporter [Clostridium sp.]
MANKNDVLVKEDFSNDKLADSLTLEELEEQLQTRLEEELSDLEFLEEEKEKIGNPDNLGEVVKGVIWEQFLNQIAVTAGEDFIKENRGLTLDLRKEAHIQTTENFANGKIATHNTEIDYQKRYDDWQDNFVKDENGNTVTHQTRSGKDEAILVKDARKPFDNNRPSGSSENHTDMDHTVPAAEIIRDPAANAHMTKEEQIEFANSAANLNEMDASLNRSKGDMSMTDWLDNPNSKGQKPNEIFDISEDDDAKLREKDAEAREEYEKRKKEAEQKSIEAGKKSRKEEAFRIGKSTVRAVLMQLLAEFVKEVIAKLVKWFKSAKKELGTLLGSLKEAIHSFIGKMKEHLINVGNTVVSTIATAIMGPVFRTIKKVWMLLKQGWNSLKDAVKYIKDPANKGKPIDLLLMEIGKIIITGLTGAGALLLGEVIEKGLAVVPIFAVEIPLLGSLANILGIFFGAVITGIIGAIGLNFIDRYIEKCQKLDNQQKQIDKCNEILSIQRKQQEVGDQILKNTIANVQSSISERHHEAAETISDALSNIMQPLEDIPYDSAYDNIIDEVDVKTNKKLDEISNDLDELLSSL